jgi:hypothetical protein
MSLLRSIMSSSPHGAMISRPNGPCVIPLCNKGTTLRQVVAIRQTGFIPSPRRSGEPDRTGWSQHSQMPARTTRLSFVLHTTPSPHATKPPSPWLPARTLALEQPVTAGSLPVYGPTSSPLAFLSSCKLQARLRTILPSAQPCQLPTPDCVLSRRTPRNAD